MEMVVQNCVQLKEDTLVLMAKIVLQSVVTVTTSKVKYVMMETNRVEMDAQLIARLN